MTRLVSRYSTKQLPQCELSILADEVLMPCITTGRYVVLVARSYLGRDLRLKQVTTTRQHDHELYRPSVLAHWVPTLAVSNTEPAFPLLWRKRWG